jgi:signal transduction histidine kinase
MSKYEQHRERLEKMFADIEHLSANPAGDIKAIQCELQELRERLQSLEANIREMEQQPETFPAPQTPTSVEGSITRRVTPILYEKDFVGFAFSGQQVQPLQQSISPKADIKNLNVALTIGGQRVGNMQVASPNNHQWSLDERALLNAVAERASQQIENLRLLSEAERARSEAENATRRYMHETWSSYLDAINQSERVGYSYDQSAVLPYLDKVFADGGVLETVKVMEEQVGRLYVKPDPSHPFSAHDKEMINSVASQVAQQVENIRLLADAARARAEAEEATRQLTRESWETYTKEEESGTFGFVYDTVKVSSLNEAPPLKQITLAQPLTVRGEAIGQLAVADWDKATPEAAGLLAAIAAQASIHLETLRLNDELRKRAAELQELDRLKSSFLANMSHELRTPLNSILGFSDVMLEELDGPLTDNMQNDLKLIQKNGQHLLHLINDVLDMAKITSGRMNLHPERFIIHEVISEVTSIISPLASEKNLALFIEKESDETIEINADRTRLRQVMINLVNNAMKFTERGKISIHVQKQNAEFIVIRVRDTGIGIPPDKLEAVFQEFTQVDTSTTRKAGGTGLGLPISRKLVEMHGGRLWAESTGIAGEGSTFYVELPIEARLQEPVEKVQK